jgi:hypothetical protein
MSLLRTMVPSGVRRPRLLARVHTASPRPASLPVGQRDASRRIDQPETLQPAADEPVEIGHVLVGGGDEDRVDAVAQVLDHAIHDGALGVGLAHRVDGSGLLVFVQGGVCLLLLVLDSAAQVLGAHGLPGVAEAEHGGELLGAAVVDEPAERAAALAGRGQLHAVAHHDDLRAVLGAQAGQERDAHGVGHAGLVDDHDPVPGYAQRGRLGAESGDLLAGGAPGGGGPCCAQPLVRPGQARLQAAGARLVEDLGDGLGLDAQALLQFARAGGGGGQAEHEAFALQPAGAAHDGAQGGGLAGSRRPVERHDHAPVEQQPRRGGALVLGQRVRGCCRCGLDRVGDRLPVELAGGLVRGVGALDERLLGVQQLARGEHESLLVVGDRAPVPSGDPLVRLHGFADLVALRGQGHQARGLDAAERVDELVRLPVDDAHAAHEAGRFGAHVVQGDARAVRLHVLVQRAGHAPLELSALLSNALVQERGELAHRVPVAQRGARVDRAEARADA